MPPSQVALSTGNLGPVPKLVVDFIDVGQGNAVLVSYPNGEFMLVDCGSQETSLTGTAYRHAQQYINSVVGTASIVCVVMTHGDNDHCIFVPDIAQAQSPTYLHFGGTVSDYDREVQTWIHSMENSRDRFVFRYPSVGYTQPSPDADFGTSTYDNDANVTVLSANRGLTPNERSIVLLVEYGNVGVILTGDAEWSTEATIIQKVPAAMLDRCIMLMPGHHGANTSTGQGWVNALRPHISVISASGTNMSYAHPSCTTNTRLKRTASNGAVQHGLACSTGRGIPYQTEQTTSAVFVSARSGDMRFTTDGNNYNLKVSSITADIIERPITRLRTGRVRCASDARNDVA